MSTIMKCPQCGNEFQPDEASRDEIKKELRAEMTEWKKRIDEENRKKEADFAEQMRLKDRETQALLEAESRRVQQEMEGHIKKKVETDYETRVRSLQQQNTENEARLNEARLKELDFLKKERELLNRGKELELEMQRRLNDETARLANDIRKQEEEKNFLKIKEYEKRIEDQNRLVEEMKRKAEQGSMQMQGEVQELALEEMLRATFPFDTVAEVGKGVRGADCIQTVRNNLGQECGKIIFESKRTKDFSIDWIEKLKADLRSQGADIAVIVTQAMPKDMDSIGEKDGVWICSFSEVRSVVQILRDLVIRVYTASKSQENKGDKMTLLYNYLTGVEFTEQWKAIREGFMTMKISIQKERDAMERMWKAREKQLEKILLSSAHIRGSIDGIAGMESIDMNLLADPLDLID